MKKQTLSYVLYPLAMISLILIMPLMSSRPDRDLDSMLFIKAAALENSDGLYELWLFCTDAESGKEHFFYGSGKAPASALKNAENGACKNLFLPSLELLFLGDGIGKDELFELSEYAIKNEAFPLSACVFYGKKELASAKYVSVSDAVKSRGLSGKVRLWQYINELFTGKDPAIFSIGEDSDGRLYFDEVMIPNGKQA